jgi:hypothetical protein
MDGILALVAVNQVCSVACEDQIAIVLSTAGVIAAVVSQNRIGT